MKFLVGLHTPPRYKRALLKSLWWARACQLAPRLKLGMGLAREV
jgi:hypothetical protein